MSMDYDNQNLQIQGWNYKQKNSWQKILPHFQKHM